MTLSILKKLQKLFLPNMGTILLMASMLFAYNAWAAPSAQNSIPGVISYQGTLTDDAGQPITGNIDMIFRFYNQPTDGAALWTENHTADNAVPVQDGLFHVMLGSLNPISPTVWTNDQLYLGIQVGSEPELLPREMLGSVPFAMQSGIALSVPDGSISTDKIADGAITVAKLDSTEWVDLSPAAGFYSPPSEMWQKAQYRKIGDIVYLRGLISKSSGDINDSTLITTLPAGFRPAKYRAFVAEPHDGLTTKHRVDIEPGGTVKVVKSAGASNHVSLDGIFFSVE